MLLGRDYCFPTDHKTGNYIHPPDNSRYWQEELNLLYVAVTRASETLLQSDTTWKYSEFLRNPERDPESAPGNDRGIDLSSQRSENEANWVAFEERIRSDPVAAFTVEQIPWLEGSPGNPLALDEFMEPTELHAFVRRWLLCMHPDKFLNKYRGRIANGERGAAKAECEGYTQAVMELRKEFAPAAEH